MASSLRRQALRIFRAALKAAAPQRAVRNHLRLSGDVLAAGRKRYQLAKFRNIYVIGAGKASVEMACAVERLLGKRIRGGLINTKYGHGAPAPRRIEVNECGHPVPDARGEQGAARIAEIARQAEAQDLLICLISSMLSLRPGTTRFTSSVNLLFAFKIFSVESMSCSLQPTVFL